MGSRARPRSPRDRDWEMTGAWRADEHADWRRADHFQNGTRCISLNFSQTGTTSSKYRQVAKSVHGNSILVGNHERVQGEVPPPSISVLSRNSTRTGSRPARSQTARLLPSHIVAVSPPVLERFVPSQMDWLAPATATNPFPARLTNTSRVVVLTQANRITSWW
jgi:hypothetical protein